MKLVYVHIYFHAARVYRYSADTLPVQNYTGTVAVRDIALKQVSYRNNYCDIKLVSPVYGQL